MKVLLFTLVASLAAIVAVAETVSFDTGTNDILLATFDGAKATTHTFSELNDPVMGGKSTGTFSVDKAGYGVFDGEVVDVPALKAPGFIKAQSDDDRSDNVAFPDIHARNCNAMVITARAKYPYDGYKLAFGDKRSLFCSFFSSGFKAPFAAPVGDDFQRVVIPFTSFSDCNSDSTGKPEKLCSKDKSVCPDEGTLKNMKTVAVWAEGAAGRVHLEIQSIAATGCDAAPATENIVKPTAVQTWAANARPAWAALVAASASPGDHCASTEYCCPDAKHCLTPTKVSCAKDASVCSADQTCCPLTKLCVHVGKPCASPCKESNTYCCPDALACLEPTNPGVLCNDASDCSADDGEVCCPLTKICVKPHEKCQPEPAGGGDVVLATFDGAKGTTRKWRQQNDPVMGGKSTGTFTEKGGVGTMDGAVVNVPFLKAPGFIKASTVDYLTPFPDVSHCSAIKITARAASGYTGYRFSFGNEHPPGGKTFSYGFKTHFDAPNTASGAFQDIVLPFSNFTDLWDDATGNPIKTCAQDKRYCPNAKALQNLVTLSVWAEGVAGKVHLDIKRIAATGCAAKAPAAAAEIAPFAGAGRQGKDTCAGPVQDTLRYIGKPPTYVPDLPLPLAKGESLADAICCDSAFAPYAEPRWYYNTTNVDFFGKVAKAYKANGNKPVTFYDSVCGIPLFNVPMNRTLAEFMAETKEHGWPSFRPAELASPDAVKILPNNYVVSKCGTHLGSNLPDAKGIRYCLDLSCVSGNPK